MRLSCSDFVFFRILVVFRHATAVSSYSVLPTTTTTATATSLESLPDAFIIVGLAFIFYAGGSLAANFAVVYQRTIPRTSLSTLMPVYSICQDVGQILAPRIDVELLKVRCEGMEKLRSTLPDWRQVVLKAVC